MKSIDDTNNDWKEDLTEFEVEMENLEVQKGPNKFQVPGEKILSMMTKWNDTLDEHPTNKDIEQQSKKLWFDFIDFERVLA